MSSLVKEWCVVRTPGSFDASSAGGLGSIQGLESGEDGVTMGESKTR